MIKKILAVTLSLSVVIPANLSAWTNHTRLIIPVIQTMDHPLLKSDVTAEPLEVFLRAEAAGLEKLFAAQEKILRQNYESYPPAPEALMFKSKGADRASADELKLRFSRAARINPSMKIPLYVYLPDGNRSARKNISFKDISVLAVVDWIEADRTVALYPGEKISALQVIASAADEPDLGFDLGLYEDNSTKFGKEYGFGRQAFGNPAYESSSQAPFHMGFYHESGVLTLAAGWIKQCYPEYRAQLYFALSKFAFETGHNYWGMRFLGWGCHYVQDLAYPYHSRIVPGVSTIKLLWAYFISMIGFPSLSDEYLSRVSDRHAAGENYLHFIMISSPPSESSAPDFFSQLKKPEKKYPGYNYRFLRDVTSLASYNLADDFDDAIAANWPYMSKWKKTAAQFSQPGDSPSMKILHEKYGSLLGIFSSSTRSYIEGVLGDVKK